MPFALEKAVLKNTKAKEDQKPRHIHTGRKHAVSSRRPHWLSTQGLARRRLGVYGLSMGTAYGLPWAADRADLDFAIVGMWGTAFANSADLADFAARVAAPLLFVARHEYPLFGYASQRDLYQAFASRERRLLAASGGHVPPDDAMLAYVNAFVRQHCAG